jgi:hypothetical protein
MKTKIALAIAAAALAGAMMLSMNGAAHAGPVLKPGSCIMETFQDAKKGTVVRCVDPRSSKIDYRLPDTADEGSFRDCYYVSKCNQYGVCRDVLVCKRGARP